MKPKIKNKLAFFSKILDDNRSFCMPPATKIPY